MILTRLAGGLGNQLFQYAAGRSLAERLGAELKLDSSWIDGEGGAGPGAIRRYRLDCFDLPFELVPARRVARLPPRTRAESFTQRMLPSRKPTVATLAQQRGPELDARIFAAADNTVLQGFWESEGYFADHAGLIRADLQFAPAPPPVAVTAMEIAAGEHTVSVHVRRGDKAGNPHTGRFASLAPSWYVAALQTLAGQIERVDAVYVFSDDAAWCREHLDLPYPTILTEGNADVDDLRLMSLCRHHVIANSTFSWWGAWLDPRPGKVVIAPERWRNDEPTIDAIPPGWLRLPN